MKFVYLKKFYWNHGYIMFLSDVNSFIEITFNIKVLVFNNFSFCYSCCYDLNIPRWILYFILLCLTAMVSYNVVVGDTVTKVLVRIFALPSQSFLASRNFVVFLATVTVTIPLCLQVWIQYWPCLSTHNYMYCDIVTQYLKSIWLDCWLLQHYLAIFSL